MVAISEIYLDIAAVAGRLLRRPELADAWEAPSALAEFDVAGLAGHLARAVFNVERYLDSPVPPGQTPIDAVRYYLLAEEFEAGPGGATQRHVRARGREAAAGGPIDLADRFDAALDRLAGRLAPLPDDQPVVVFDRHVLPLAECLVTRLVELVVHLDDLAVSLGRPTPPVPAAACDLVIVTLSRIAVERHGALAVIRTLARRERAPATIAAF